MDNIITFINKKSKNKFIDLKLVSADFCTKTNELEIYFITDNKKKYSDEIIDELKQIIGEYLENKIKFNINIKKQVNTEESYQKLIVDLVQNNPLFSLCVDYQKINCTFENEKLNVNFLISSDTFDAYLKEKLEESCITKLKENEANNVDFFYKKQIINQENIIERRKEEIIEENEQNNISQKIVLSNVKEYLGKMKISGSVILPENINKGDKNIIVVGQISNINEYKSHKGEGEEQKEYSYYKFNLVSEETIIDCVCFLKKASDLLNLKDGEKVAVLCDTDEYNSRVSLRIKALSLCKFDFPKKIEKLANKYYKTVKPFPYISKEQVSFLENIDSIKSEYLLNNTFVVFDLETTGLDTSSCKIIEIGAVKVEQGKITQQFSTFVNPMEHIPDDATLKNNITDEMVKDAPTIEEVMPDFYKFIENSIIVAHNIAYDYPIISRFAKKMGYNINNKREDTLLLSQKYLGQLRHFKLSVVCHHLGVSLVGAHRAVNDTVATAKVFIKLIEKYKN